MTACLLTSPQVSRTLLSILADLNGVGVSMVSTHPLISKSPCPCTNLFVTVPSSTITIGITVTFMFHSFCSSLARSRYLSLFSLSFSFIQWSAGTAKSSIRQVIFFCWLLLGLVVWSRLGDPREFFAFHSQDVFWDMHIQFVRMFKLLVQFPVDHLS